MKARFYSERRSLNVNCLIPRKELIRKYSAFLAILTLLQPNLIGADASQQLALVLLSGDAGDPRIHLEDPPGHVEQGRQHGPWTDGVDRDPVLAEFVRQALCEPDGRELRGAVGGEPGRTCFARL